MADTCRADPTRHICGSFQNGVLNEDLLAEAYGATHVLGGVTCVATTLTEPGVITQSVHLGVEPADAVSTQLRTTSR